ncbi:hypothetical protein [Arthrobacter sp. D3-16]
MSTEAAVMRGQIIWQVDDRVYPVLLWKRLEYLNKDLVRAVHLIG